MIDILLVLLIIFMVIVPVTPKGLAALAPHPPKGNPPIERAVVVQVLHRAGEAPVYKINDTDFAKADLLPKLTAIYANRAERVMFVKADDGIEFRYVAEVVDIGRAASVEHIGLMTPKIMAGE
jgi:biopolymer transport protein ExbD